jgi:transcriptional regulator with XRE-family HTH domain
MMQGSLAERLRVLRARQGLSLTEASKRAGITRDTLSDLERGKRHAYMPTLAKIANGYGVPVEELLEEPVHLAEASQETRRLEDKRLEAELPQDPLQWEKILASVLDRQREVEAKVEELIALGVGEANPYQVQWALDEAQECWHTLLLALPGSRWEHNKIVSKFNPYSMDKSQWEQRKQSENAGRFYYEILERLMEAGLVEFRERPGQNAEPVAVGIGA